MRIALLWSLALCAVAAGPAPPRISILNGADYFDDATLADLRALGSVQVHRHTRTVAEVRERLKGADIAVVDPYEATLGDALTSAASLKLLVLTSTGTDRVDIAAAASRGTRVANTPDYATEAVAEQAFALLLALSRKVRGADTSMRSAPSQANAADPVYLPLLGFELQGRTLGIVGFGRIGRRVAQIGKGFGMKVVAWDRHPPDVTDVVPVDLDQLLKESDVVSLHLPETPETAGIIDARRLAMMKRSAVLINTARAGLVDEIALVRALQGRLIAGAGLDVIKDESSANPLLALDNVVLSPHSGFYTSEALRRRSQVIVATIRAFVGGQPVNLIEPKVAP